MLPQIPYEMRTSSLGITACLLAATFYTQPSLHAQEPAADMVITPTDVYYLAESINASLMATYGVADDFSAEWISRNLKPANVLLRTKWIVRSASVALEGFDITQGEAKEVLDAEPNPVKPGHVYSTLGALRSFLESKNAYAEHQGKQITRTPSDVYHNVRRLSHTLANISRKNGNKPFWQIPAGPYQIQAEEIMPYVETLVQRKGSNANEFLFPKEAVAGVKPQHIYIANRALYRNISAMAPAGFKPVVFEEVKGLGAIGPDDVFDLCIVIASEIRIMAGAEKTIHPANEANYKQWKTQVPMIKPGHVYSITQFNLQTILHRLK